MGSVERFQPPPKTRLAKIRQILSAGIRAGPGLRRPLAFRHRTQAADSPDTASEGGHRGDNSSLRQLPALYFASDTNLIWRRKRTADSMRLISSCNSPLPARVIR